MPVYESIKNADNKIVISAQNKDSVVFGWEKVVDALAAKVAAGAKTIAIDGWYGINYEKIANALAAKIGGEVALIPARELFVSREAIVAYNQPYVTDDPGFGKVNKTGVIEDIMDKGIVAASKGRYKKRTVNYRMFILFSFIKQTYGGSKLPPVIVTIFTGYFTAPSVIKHGNGHSFHSNRGTVFYPPQDGSSWHR